MADIIDVAQADFEKAKSLYERFLQAKFGTAWAAHYSDYTYDMSACIGRTFFRGMHEASRALEAAKSTDRA